MHNIIAQSRIYYTIYWNFISTTYIPIYIIYTQYILYLPTFRIFSSTSYALFQCYSIFYKVQNIIENYKYNIEYTLYSFIYTTYYLNLPNQKKLTFLYVQCSPSIVYSIPPLHLLTQVLPISSLKKVFFSPIYQNISYLSGITEGVFHSLQMKNDIFLFSKLSIFVIVVVREGNI